MSNECEMMWSRWSFCSQQRGQRCSRCNCQTVISPAYYPYQPFDIITGIGNSHGENKKIARQQQVSVYAENLRAFGEHRDILDAIINLQVRHFIPTLQPCSIILIA
jgi:hypothetical protein